MANRQQKRAPRTTTNIVVRNGTAANQARASGSAAGNRRRRNRARRQAQVNVRVLPSQNQSRRRFPRRQGVGSRIVFQKINSTLGTVGSNGSEQIECELTCLMNPATMKEATGSNSFTPLGIYASTYSLFKMTKCTLVLKPLVGDSAVSGTVIRASWNPTSTPTQTSWSALGARKHVDVTPGKTGRFTLTSRDLVGPKGGWFKTNTKGDPMMAFAGTLEIHTLGKTMSTYKNEAFTGSLFLAELETQWQFKDYAQQPGMLNLVKGEDKSAARIEKSDDGKLQLVVPGTSRMARASSGAASEIIWLVTDTIIQAGTSLLGPFGWLIRGGWWLVKRAANAPVRRNGDTTFDIYASISDARANMPCITDQASVNIPVGGLHFQQVTPGNTGIAAEATTSRAIMDLTPSSPTQCYVISATMCKPGTTNLVPAACRWFNKNGGQNHSQGVGFKAGDAKVATYNIYRVVAHTNNGPIDPSMFTHKIPFYLFTEREWELGYAVASSYERINESPSIWVSSVLVYATQQRYHAFNNSWNVTDVTYPETEGSNGYQAKVATSGQVQTINLQINVEPGKWYVAQFVIQGVIDGQYMSGEHVLASRGTTSVPTGTRYFAPRANDPNMGLLPVYISGLHLTPFTTDAVAFNQNRMLALDDLHPSFGCDDAFEAPPSSGEGGPSAGEDGYEDPDEDEDEELELGPDDHYSDPPLSRLVVRPEAQLLYENLVAQFSDREARLAVNQLYPSDEYTEFTEVYHDALADGLSPRAARAQALGL
nr:ORF2 [Porcine astrovirus 2]